MKAKGVGKEIGLTELGPTFDGVEERGREVTPRQRDHMCKDKRDLKGHCHG